MSKHLLVCKNLSEKLVLSRIEMKRMKYLTVVLLLLGWSFLNHPIEGCEILDSPVGYIDKYVVTGYEEYDLCWTIPVSTGKFVQLKMINMTIKEECFISYAEILFAEKEETYKFCKSSDFKNIITALSNVTVNFIEKSVNFYYDYYAQIGFHLEYVVRDIECINKNSFRCSNTSCIPQAEVCDGIEDCENGADEIGCERGVLSLPGVGEARNQAVSFLKMARTSSWGWRDNTPRGVVALYLASDANFNGTTLEEELIAKETEIKVAVALLRPSLTDSELSMFVHALLVTCHNPRDFHGNNLVKRLKEQVEKSPKVSHPIAYLALCNAHESWPPKADSDLKAILNNSLEYPFMKDLQAMAILALSCKTNSTAGSATPTTLKLYRSILENLKSFQQQDGSFGNFHTTALIAQALITSGHENSKDWKLNATVRYLMNELNSPSVDFLSVYLALPILNGKSLTDVSKVNCSAHPRADGDDPITEVNEFLGPKMRVRYSLYIGDERDVSHAISLRVPENYTAFQVMQLAEIEDQKFKFDWKMMTSKMYVYKIANVSNDPENGKFWLLYVCLNKEAETCTHFAKGPEEITLKDGQELIFWYKTASI